MRVKGKMLCVSVCVFKAGYCIVRKLLYLLSSFSWKRLTSLSCQNEVLFQLNYYSSELLPRKLNRRLTKYPAKRMSFKKTYRCVYSCVRPANRSLESAETGKWHSTVAENPIAQNSDVL